MHEMSEHIAELAAALAKAQAAVQPAVKDKTNPAFRSRYADLSSVWEACRVALNENGLSVVQMPTNHQEGYASLRTLLLHTSGQYLATTVSARLVKDDAQGLGSALTYLRRYSLAAMIGVVADDDDDGNAASGRHDPQRGTTQRTPAPQPTAKGAGFNPEREQAITAMRAAFKQAKNAGAGVAAPDKDVAVMSLSEIVDWTEVYRAAAKDAPKVSAAA